MDAARLQHSFSAVAAHGDELPLYFYSHLFLTHPETRPMFPPAMAGQRDRFVRALIEVVGKVHQVQAVVPYLQQLGRDHRKYGVKAEHYPVVGVSLLATLEHFLGEDWTPELAADWAAAYDLVAKVMTNAAAESEETDPAFWDAEVVGHERRGPGIAVITVRTDQRLPYVPGQSVSVQSPLAAADVALPLPGERPADRQHHRVPRACRRRRLGQPRACPRHREGRRPTPGPAVGNGLTLDESSDADLLLLAGGTGLAPAAALIEQLDGRRQRRNVDLYVGARTEDELYDLPALRQLQERNRWLTVVPVVQLGLSPGLAIGEPARVAVGHRHWRGAQVYVCGSGEMVTTSLEVLATAGIDPHAVRRESYTYNGHVGSPVDLRQEARA